MQEYIFEQDADNCVSSGNFLSDRWVIGESADQMSEYVIHLAEPPFMAKFWHYDTYKDNVLFTEPGPKVVIGDSVFYDITWFDYVPGREAMIGLLEAANEPITLFALRKHFL